MPHRPHYGRAVSRLPYLRRDELTPGGQEVWDSIVGSRGAALVTDQGALTGPFNAFVHAPDVGRHLTSLGQVLRFETSIERRLSELAIILNAFAVPLPPGATPMWDDPDG